MKPRTGATPTLLRRPKRRACSKKGSFTEFRGAEIHHGGGAAASIQTASTAHWSARTRSSPHPRPLPAVCRVWPTSDDAHLVHAVDARRPSWFMPSGLVGAEPASYERYVLALYWQPEWTYDACARTSGQLPASAALVAATDNLAADAYALNRLSLHGLWPEYDDAQRGFAWPEFCDSPAFNYSSCTPRARPIAPPIEELETPCTQLSAETRHEFNVSERWQSHAMGYAWREGMAAHEWARHGSCMGGSQRDYFRRSHELLVSVEGGDGAGLVRRAAADGNCSTQELRLAFASDTGALPTLRCERSCHLSEVWLGMRALQVAPNFIVPSMAHGQGVPLSNASIDTCIVHGCDRVRLRRWEGCPPLPPSAPPLPAHPPPPPRWPPQPPPPAELPYRTAALLLAVALLVGFALRTGRQRLRLHFGLGGRPVGSQRLPSSQHDESSRGGGKPMRAVEMATVISTPEHMGLGRLIHDEGDEIID